jgi:hypothetical protein
MQRRIRLAGMTLATMGLIMLGIGCSSSSTVQQPPPTSYMKSAVGTPNELSPLAPPGACNVHKVGNRWTCEVNGQTMVYNEAASRWEPQPK